MRQFKTQKEMYKWIWENRSHVSEISGKPLLNQNHIQFIWQFAHILPKGSYPKWKLNPDNIMLMLPYEHENQEQYLLFIEKQNELKREYYKEFYSKEF